MKAAKLITIFFAILLLTSCGSKENKSIRLLKNQEIEPVPVNIPLDKGFSEYISGYTSGIIPANSQIEIRFTPEFAAKADKSVTGLFVFEPSIKGKTEWKDETTLVFTPSRILDPGKIFTGGLNLSKLGEVKERLKVFPMRIQTLKRDFRITIGSLECTTAEGNSYLMNGQIIASDFIEPTEVENYLTAKLGRNRMEITWDHSLNLIHKFTINGIERTAKPQELTIAWDGSSSGVKEKGSHLVNIPPEGVFSIIDLVSVAGENQRIDILFSDPVDASQETEGLIRFDPQSETTVNINSNIISIFPVNRLQGKVDVNVESSVRSNKGAVLTSAFLKQLDFTSVTPGILLEGNGVILPSSKNLIFPFKAANLKAVDLKIIKIFDNNLPYFLQDNDINGGNSVKRFGRPVYSGRVDLVNGSGMNTSTWNLYTIDLSDYIDVEPGILYKVDLGMRRSYSLYPCGGTGEISKYE
jgi:alpha-2-macroglobulin